MIRSAMLPLALGFTPALVLAPILAAAPAAAQAPAAAPPRALTADEHAALRCAAAFAIISGDQARGEAAARQFPPLAARGREFFVITAARLMDDAGLDEAAIKAAAQAEAAGLRQGGAAPIMPFCLTLLDAQVPPRAAHPAP